MPVAGDIHIVHNARLGACVAYQLTHQDAADGSFAILALDWVGSALPDAATVAAMQPARFSAFRAAPALMHRWAGKRVPRDFQQVGWREPLIPDPPRSYGSWPRGAEWIGQRHWDALDADTVRAFHAAMSAPEDQSVVLERDAFPVRRCTRVLDSATLNHAPSLCVFGALPLLTQLEITTPVPGLLPWLCTRPLIHTLQISGLRESELDVRGTRLMQMTIDATGLRSLHLNPQLDRLTLTGSIDPGLIIHAEDEGRWLTLISTDPLLPGLGLPRLGELQLREVRELDAARIAGQFPELQSLTISGAPCVLHQLHHLGDLRQLHTLGGSELFPPAEALFPAPECWPRLCRLWLHSLPIELGTAIKKAYKGEVAKGLDLDVGQLRRPEWLAANLDNPFRNWEGSAHVSAVQAKKAATLYRKACTEALKLSTGGGDTTGLGAALAQIGRDYTEGFNALDRHSGFIETEEREQIYMAWMSILDAVQARREPGAAALDREFLRAAMNDVRKF
ncbi:gliding motility protein [Stenotrophomonas maltophilia]|uniref:gliding motility protein n=1 Tax=Stenotrophomonas maltophilia TaxID=40324 RepID=UPI0013DC6843|nr:gliding motility protein [Stenotrophomonas maltophilia]